MKIDQNIITTDLGQTAELTTNFKSLTELSPGDIFRATVLDIKPDQVSIRLGNGNELTAKSLILPEARIGSDTLFTVKDNIKGQLILEMVKPNTEMLKGNIAKEALLSAGLGTSSENIGLVKTLMDSNLPIDRPTLQKAAFFNYSQKGITAENLLFLLKENMPMEQTSIKVLNDILNGQGFAQKLSGLADDMFKLPPSLLADTLEAMDDFFELQGNNSEIHELIKNIRQGIGASKGDIQAVKQMLMLNPSNQNIKELNSYFKNLAEALMAVEKVIGTRGGREGSVSEVDSKVREIINQIDFMNHIENYKEYIQIPFSLNGREQTAELYIFKEPKRKQNYTHSASILLGLDYEELGRVEVFIQKTDNNLQFQIKSDLKASLQAIKANFGGLAESLSLIGYNVSDVAYKDIGEAFNVAKDMSMTSTESKRYSFDMRV